MVITPLRYRRYSAGPNNGAIVYGFQSYLTDCRRFAISKTGLGWTVVTHFDDDYFDDWASRFYDAWAAWLDNIGLADAVFTTRRAATQALMKQLEMDDVLHAREPSEL